MYSLFLLGRNTTARATTTLQRNSILLPSSSSACFYFEKHPPQRSCQYHTTTTTAHQNNNNTMKLYRPAAALLATTMVVVASGWPSSPSSRQRQRVIQAEAASSSSRFFSSSSTSAKQVPSSTTSTSNTLYPLDIHYSGPTVKQALEEIRQEPRQTPQQRLPTILRSCYQEGAVTLTLVGYKGGPLDKQINQDRALIVQNDANKVLLMGCFDGHAPRGEIVSEHVQQHFLKTVQQHSSSTTPEQALHQTFLQLDKQVPGDPSGGCTATVLYRPGGNDSDTVYCANAGDSRTFIAAYRRNANTATVLFITEEDKPDLPHERARVEKAGGQVYIPNRGTSRVVYHDRVSGAPTGLAMSRSIGDWDAGQYGVIPDPTVTPLSISQLVETVKKRKKHQHPNDGLDRSIFCDISETLSEKPKNGRGTKDDEDDIYIFAVCATDGLMDYVTPQEIVSVMGHALYAQEGVHPITAGEHLLYVAADRWQQAKLGRYRDDIAVAISTLRRPPKE